MRNVNDVNKTNNAKNRHIILGNPSAIRLAMLSRVTENDISLGISLFSPVVKDGNFSLIPLSSLNLIKFNNHGKIHKTDLVGSYNL